MIAAVMLCDQPNSSTIPHCCARFMVKCRHKQAISPNMIGTRKRRHAGWAMLFLPQIHVSINCITGTFENIS